MSGHSKIQVSMDTVGGGEGFTRLIFKCEEDMAGVTCDWQYSFNMHYPHTFRELAMAVAQHRQDSETERYCNLCNKLALLKPLITVVKGVEMTVTSYVCDECFDLNSHPGESDSYTMYGYSYWCGDKNIHASHSMPNGVLCNGTEDERDPHVD